MSDAPPRHPTTVTDWSDHRRRAHVRATRFGASWRPPVLRMLARAAVVVLLPVLVVASLYWNLDVRPEAERLAHTEPQIHSIADAAAPADSRTAVVDLVGLGNLDAAPTARTLTSFTEIGQVWAVQYDNAGIDTRVISDLIAERAGDAAVDHIVLSGHSMGGVIALEVARHLYHDTDIVLTGVVLDSTPLDLHSVRPESRDAGEEMMRWVGWLPGARESRSLRLLVEVAARKDRFLDGGLFRDGTGLLPDVDLRQLYDVLGEVGRDKIMRQDVASNSLIESQFAAIVASGASRNLGALTEPVGDKPRPGVVFLRPRHAAADRVVDVDHTQRTLFDVVGGSNGTLRVVRMDGTGHANPNQAPGAYNTAIERQVVPYLRANLREPRPLALAEAPR
ncbi:alpha/beta hydrolase [Rhodococcus sp. HNM0569]|uniref:alpha/beta hydrolase n=1 Tax=Rhodococcus sp. HNM0569 TaxID=2716340 RepID=UPI001469ADAB|nr:alpha/beta hydrolase [Rhodococcus sp. HNM0569]NLU84297.1 alpha/beta hydrolase [Rhodococcus sp. HNM0569]